ncbi:hypothetical protein MKEN_01018800 [Mycena kentingensis (nom. inval.)]|nr:hypothetical protein MKEN_01018800 [Mycena kentingensis (nom. inval.)]
MLKNRPFDALPPEILSTIFLACITTHPQPHSTIAPLLIAQISRRWRLVALETPALWCYIVVSGLRADHCRDVLVLWSQRAGALPLTYDIAAQTDELGRDLLDDALRFQQRWKDVKLSLPAAAYSALTVDAHMFPLLRKLSIRPRYQPWNAPQAMTLSFLNAPLLTDLDISASEISGLKVLAPYSQLHSLTLVCGVEDLHILRDCSALVNLSAYVVSLDNTEVPESIRADPIRLGSVESITVLAPELLHLFVLPSLHSLAFSLAPETDASAILALLESWEAASSIETLDLRMVWDAASFEVLLVGLPSVTTLHVDFALDAYRHPSAVKAVLGLLADEWQGNHVVLPHLQTLRVQSPAGKTYPVGALLTLLRSRARGDLPGDLKRMKLDVWALRPNELPGIAQIREVLAETRAIVQSVGKGHDGCAEEVFFALEA